MEELTKKLTHNWAKAAVQNNHALQMGIVWCRECGRRLEVNSAACLRGGWPKCHGATMSLNPPISRVEQILDKHWEDSL